MLYNCRLYRDTGFNANNIPDRPELLDSPNISHTDVGQLDIMQCRNLSKIRVRCTWKQARNVDYIRLQDEEDTWFYAASNATMVNTDTCEFDVETDFINSRGGINNIHILDGITERVHVSDDDKVYSCEGDPLLNANEPLEIVDEWCTPDAGKRYVVVECTVDPIKTMTDSAAVTAKYTDPVTGDETSVTYPALTYPASDTQYGIGQKVVKTGTTLYLKETSDTSSAPLPNVGIWNGLSNLQALGVAQGAIIRQYEFPAEMANMFTVVDGVVTRVNSKRTELTLSDVPNAFSGRTCKNKLLKYSPVQKFGMMTAAGNSAEYNLEDMINKQQASPNYGNVDCSISMVTDPRPDGRPYYRPQWLNGKMAGSNNYGEFWRNCLAGMQWKQLPLIFTEASGNALNTQKFLNSAGIADIGRRAEHTAWGYNTAQAAVNGVVGAVQNLASIASWDAMISPGKAVSGVAGAIGSTINSGLSIANMTSQENFAKQKFTAGRKSELYDLYTSNFTVAPTVNFPYNSDTIRDNIGNGVLCYQYRYTTTDWNRIDKLLTMYGYRISKPLEKSDFTNRKYFNFVACNNVTITGDATWINEGIAEQLKSGVRVWHVLPSANYYNDNPINS